MNKAFYIGTVILITSLSYGVFLSFDTLFFLGIAIATCCILVSLVFHREEGEFDPFKEFSFEDIVEHHPEYINYLSRIIGKSILAVFIIGAIVLFIMSNKHHIMSFIESIPWLYAVWQHTHNEIATKSLLGFTYINIVIGMFFITFPVEIIFLTFLAFGHNPIILAIIAVITALATQILNYVIGLLFGEKLLRFIFKEKYDKVREYVNSYGSIVILIGNILPLPIQMANVFLGAMRYSFKKMLLYTLIGRIIKHIILILGSDFFSTKLLPWLETIFKKS